MLVVLSMMRGRYFDPRHLLVGSAVLVHVATCGHGVHINNRRSVNEFERNIGRIRAVIARRSARCHTVGTRPAGQGDQRHISLAHCDRLSGMSDVYHVGRATGLRRIHMAYVLQTHVVDHRQRPKPGRVTRTVVSIHVVRPKPRVGERTRGALCVELSDRLIDRLPRRMFVNPRYEGLAFDGHGQHDP